MIDHLLADAFNGFSLNDLPFLFLQLTVSAIGAWILRGYWQRVPLEKEESWLASMAVVLQAVLTLLAVFAQRSPWVAVVFGFCLLPVGFAGHGFSMRSRVFFILQAVLAWGLGSGNFVVTILAYFIIVWPLLHFGATKK